MAKNLEIKVTLQHVENPEVWRKIIFPADGSFEQLNHAIQYSMEWEDIENYNFDTQKEGKEIHITAISDDPDFDYSDLWLGDTLDAEKVAVGEYLNNKGDKILYVYGDDAWHHTVEVVDVTENAYYPLIGCTDAQGACPSPLVTQDASGYRCVKELFGYGYESPMDTLFLKDNSEKYPLSKETIRCLMDLCPDDDFNPNRCSMAEISKRLEIWVTNANLKLLHSDETILYDASAYSMWLNNRMCQVKGILERA